LSLLLKTNKHTYLCRPVGQLQLGAGPHQDNVRGALAVLDDVGALLNALAAGAWEVRHILPRQGNASWPLAVFYTDLRGQGA